MCFEGHIFTVKHTFIHFYKLELCQTLSPSAGEPTAPKPIIRRAQTHRLWLRSTLQSKSQTVRQVRNSGVLLARSCQRGAGNAGCGLVERRSGCIYHVSLIENLTACS